MGDNKHSLKMKYVVSKRRRVLEGLAILLIGAAAFISWQSHSKTKERNIQAAKVQAYENQLGACRSQFVKDPLVPIVGGGFLDARRFAFNVPTARFENNECGTDGFETSFYWTGEKILPMSEKFTGLHPTKIPKEWHIFHVGARLGNRRLGLECREKFDPTKCIDPSYKAPYRSLPVNWPEELTAHMKNYELDVRLPETPETYVTNEVGFVLRNWPHEEGQPRFVMCSIGQNVNKMTREQFENLDFGTRTLPCQLEGWDFGFKGGGARVKTGTEALKDITPALKALNQYLSDSIIKG